MTCIKMAMEKAEVERTQLEAVGITNQRESTLVWNRCVACHLDRIRIGEGALSLFLITVDRLFTQENGSALPQRHRVERHAHPRHLRGAQALLRKSLPLASAAWALCQWHA